jgi:nucleotide-binding universal stress UspA family protein
MIKYLNWLITPFSLLKFFNSKIWFVHITTPDPEFVGYEVGPQYIRDSVVHNLREEHKALQNHVDNVEKLGILSEGLLIQGPTVPMILEESEKLKIDLIIIGSHEHGFLYNALFGSTTSVLLRKSKTPILVIPIG